MWTVGHTHGHVQLVTPRPQNHAVMLSCDLIVIIISVHNVRDETTTALTPSLTLTMARLYKISTALHIVYCCQAAEIK